MRMSTRGTSTVSIVALIVSNLVPLFGVLLLDWSLHMIIIMFWIESGIIGAFNVVKIAMARGTDDATSGSVPFMINDRSIGSMRSMPRVLLVPFFILHYGIFWVVHGVFVFLLPTFAGLGALTVGTAETTGPFRAVEFGGIDPRGVLIGAGGLAISHAVSFVVNFLGGREYLTASPAVQMFSVYGRVVVLHVTILGGAFLVGRLGTPLAALAILLIGKIVVDLGFHVREHRRARDRAAVAAGA